MRLGSGVGCRLFLNAFSVCAVMGVSIAWPGGMKGIGSSGMDEWVLESWMELSSCLTSRSTQLKLTRPNTPVPTSARSLPRSMSSTPPAITLPTSSPRSTSLTLLPQPLPASSNARDTGGQYEGHAQPGSPIPCQRVDHGIISPTSLDGFSGCNSQGRAPRATAPRPVTGALLRTTPTGARLQFSRPP